MLANEGITSQVAYKNTLRVLTIWSLVEILIPIFFLLHKELYCGFVLPLAYQVGMSGFEFLMCIHIWRSSKETGYIELENHAVLFIYFIQVYVFNIMYFAFSLGVLHCPVGIYFFVHGCLNFVVIVLHIYNTGKRCCR